MTERIVDLKTGTLISKIKVPRKLKKAIKSMLDKGECEIWYHPKKYTLGFRITTLIRK